MLATRERDLGGIPNRRFNSGPSQFDDRAERHLAMIRNGRSGATCRQPIVAQTIYNDICGRSRLGTFDRSYTKLAEATLGTVPERAAGLGNICKRTVTDRRDEGVEPNIETHTAPRAPRQTTSTQPAKVHQRLTKSTDDLRTSLALT